MTEITKDRIRRFKKVKRAYYSLIILCCAYVLSLFCNLIANDTPFMIQYKGDYYFPMFKFYSDKTFGGKYDTEAEYWKLKNSHQFIEEGGWMVQPLIPHNPLHSDLDLEGTPPHSPSKYHWFGTDSQGRDVLSRLIYGFRICMSFSLMLTFVVSILGIIVGGIQGYVGGKLDLFLRHGIEIWASLPFLYVVILLGSIYGRSFMLLLFILSLFSWIGLSYYMRGEFYKTKNLNYIKMAKVLGIRPIKILYKHILPNTLTPVVTLVPFILIGGIGSLTSLDFLGFGLQPPTPSWGELLEQGLKNLYAPWITIYTILALFITLLLATFIGEGVREAFDPKSNSRIE